MLVAPISVIFCGHLGNAEELDGAALAVSVRAESLINWFHRAFYSDIFCALILFQIINVSYICTAQGLATACDTFFSQSFGGSNKKLVGVYMQRGKLLGLNIKMYGSWT